MKNNLDTLVTGGRGLVGSSLSGDINRVGSEFDLRDKAVTDKLFSDLSPKNVIHCAARVGGLGGNMNHKGEFFYDNIMMNTNVIESCRIHNVKKISMFFIYLCIP